MCTLKSLTGNADRVVYLQRAEMPATLQNRFSSGSMYEIEDRFSVFTVDESGELTPRPDCVGHWESHAYAHSDSHDIDAQTPVTALTSPVVIVRRGFNYCPDAGRDERWNEVRIYE